MMRRALQFSKLLFAAALVVSACAPAGANDDTLDLVAATFAQQVDRRLNVPDEEQARYAGLLEAALQSANLNDLPSQYIAVVDRDPQVQAILIFRLDAQATPHSWKFIGAAAVSTGKPGRIDYFTTPTGVFTHSIANMDFRAEGTKNKNGILGYGRKGMRVFDFGWAYAKRGWGDGAYSQMRLQMHATDPQSLEPRLGEPASKGCIRIPASLNDFLDRYALLDADYERALATGARLWLMRADRAPVPDPGRYLVVVDSGLAERPAWSPAPAVHSERREGRKK